MFAIFAIAVRIHFDVAEKFCQIADPLRKFCTEQDFLSASQNSAMICDMLQLLKFGLQLLKFGLQLFKFGLQLFKFSLRIFTAMFCAYIEMDGENSKI